MRGAASVIFRRVSDPEKKTTREDLLRLLGELEALADEPIAMAELSAEERQRFMMASGKISSPSPGERRKLRKTLRRRDKEAVKSADEALLNNAGIRALRRAPVFQTPPRLLPGQAALGFSLPSDGEPDEARARMEMDAANPSSRATDASGDGAPRAGSAATGGSRVGGPDGFTPAGGGAGDSPSLREDRKCYVCKRAFRQVHRFYDQMCEACAELNWDKRNQSADMTGRVAVITGSRVKIGYHAAIKLLRAGAHVVATTRFPRDSAARYAREEDFEQWRDRLDVIGLDLRHTPSVERFASHLVERFEKIDYLIQNACQTVRRPPGFYAHLVSGESKPSAAHERQLLASWDALRRGKVLARGDESDHRGLHDPEGLSQVPLTDEDHRAELSFFPEGQLDADLQQVDLRGRNSWRLTLDEVSTVELLEVQLVNAIAPFVLAARLRPRLAAVTTRDSHVVNVSAMEGQFYRAFKTDRHPHTNMAKAALNMMTRTSAADYIKDGIHMNSVDTGWITDEDPHEIAQRKTAEHGFHPPLDVVDGAARIVAPIFDGLISGKHVWGQFLKDYAPTPW